ncbi:alpha/beta hydrolase family protein [Aquabacterium humicola]|uniref:alpha/beta hydrolase family protein n=1 Tax=Aquabacterium humicola TaxID=3237377 RepID=UPI002542F37D|nr:prolyl oligopeptidase family serine peptidase [Rubrivivax pictus]
MTSSKTWRRLGALACAWACLAAPTAQAADTPAPVPIEAFFSAPAMSTPVLSPDGQRAAVLVADERSGRMRLGVLEFGPPMKLTLIASFSDADVEEARWVNDNRLVFSLSNSLASAAYQRAPGLWAVNRDGTERRRLVGNDWQAYFLREPSAVNSRELAPNHLLLRVLRDGSNDVVVLRYNFDRDYREVVDTTPLRLDTVTGRAVSAAEPGHPGGARRWVVDGRGVPRMLYTEASGTTTVHWRPGAAAPWRQVASYPTFAGGPGEFDVETIGPDGVIYASAVRGDAERTRALYRFDQQALKLESQPLLGVAGFDFDGQLVFDRRAGKLLGVHYTSDAPATEWLDPSHRQLQEKIDKRLPGLVNRLAAAECGCSRWMVITSQSDRQPPLFFLYDRETDQLQLAGRSKPAIDAKRMAERDFVRFKARDGQQIPLHVTKPAGKGPWPTVVLVHGGPWVRGGHWEWTDDSQFLASRGYLVLEPEFRGSTGYGERLFRAGWKQWGLKAQDDVADAARWAIGEKLADDKRICIAGASYGGYATLMGLIRDPDLYRCGVSWVAVTDINLMYDITWSDFSETWTRFGMPVLIGDREKDAAQLEATSPLKQAHRLKQPLLLAFGGGDRRVPIDHGTKFRDAVKKTNERVEWIVYNEEGHGWFKPENRYDFYARMEKFLATHLQAR